MIALVTDSTACLTKKDVEELGVVLIPMSYSFGGTSYTETFTDVSGPFETLLRSGGGTFRTSQSNTSTIMKTFFKLREEGSEILCLTISSRLSGMYQNARSCALELGEASVQVIDTGTTAGGLLILLRAARRLIDEGLPLSEITSKLAELCTRIRIVFSVNDMAPLRHSGRLGPVRQSVGTVLNIKPILICKDGHIVAFKLVRGNQARIAQLCCLVSEDAEDVVVHHLQAELSAALIALELRDRCRCPVTTRKISPTLGIHVGTGVIGVAWLDPAKKD